MNKEKVLIIIGVMIMAITIGSAMIYNSISTNLINGNLIASTTTTENDNVIKNKEETYSLQLYDDRGNVREYPNVTMYHTENNTVFRSDTFFVVKQIITPDVMFESNNIENFSGGIFLEKKYYNDNLEDTAYRTDVIPSQFTPIEKFDFTNVENLYFSSSANLVGYKFNGLQSLELTYSIWGINSNELVDGNVVYTKSFEYKLKEQEIENVSATVTKGDSKQRFSVNSNELMNVKNKTNDIPIFEAISNSLITNYVDGKKTAFLTCKYGEYRDTSNNIVYNGSDGKCISIGDYVIPYKRKNGVDVPLAKYINGNPMVFIVTSSEIVYNGYININIELLERTDN